MKKDILLLALITAAFLACSQFARYHQKPNLPAADNAISARSLYKGHRVKKQGGFTSRRCKRTQVLLSTDTAETE